MKKIIFETYRDVNTWILNQVEQKKPSCYNDMVRVKRYKITVEEIKESNKVIIERLKDLYKKETNWHNKESIDAYSKKIYGIRIFDLLEKED